jgi:hypothetical protein
MLWKTTLATVALFGTFALGSAALAGAGDHKGPNGGQMKDVGHLHVEVVVRPGQILVYLFDAKDAKLPSAGATGKATILVKGKKTEVALAPDGDNRLSGKGDFAEDKSLTAVVNVALSGQKPVQGRFEPLK